uniref:Ig-like domain-containing protein n=1 Tax=Acanthochromis polyacanthus TaxID=80966 RepID=A0A3Q1I4B3_9TELE
QPFRCHVFNPVSNGTSDPVNIMVIFKLYVIFGPENTNLLLSPSEEYFFLWFLNGESLLHTEPELILTNIQMNNAGNYRCQPRRAEYGGVRKWVGPENTNILLTPSEEYFAEGSDVRLFCSAESRPPAQFLWFLNGESLPHPEPELILTNIQMSNAGNYSCQTFNNKTMRNETSEPKAISVLGNDWSQSCHHNLN